MDDTVIRGGTIFDGTGQAAFIGDVAIKNGRIGQIGGRPGLARQTIGENNLAGCFGFHGCNRLAIGKKASVTGCKPTSPAYSRDPARSIKERMLCRATG